jgi:hypothetical protein
MADKKISALTGATTPLAGTEVLPIVQSGATVKVAVSDLTAGRAVATAAITATGIVSTSDATDASSTTAASMKTAGGLAVVKKIYVGDNIVPATAAKGVNFTANTPAAGMTSQLLNWYEEGTWTPTLTANVPGDLAISSYAIRTGRYTRVGRLITVEYNIFISAGNFTWTTASGLVRITGLPFTAGATLASGSVSFQGITKVGYTNFCNVIDQSDNRIYLYASGSAVSAATVTIANIPTGGAVLITGSVTYST